MDLGNSDVHMDWVDCIYSSVSTYICIARRINIDKGSSRKYTSRNGDVRIGSVVDGRIGRSSRSEECKMRLERLKVEETGIKLKVVKIRLGDTNKENDRQCISWMGDCKVDIYIKALKGRARYKYLCNRSIASAMDLEEVLGKYNKVGGFLSICVYVQCETSKGVLKIKRDGGMIYGIYKLRIEMKNEEGRRKRKVGLTECWYKIITMKGVLEYQIIVGRIGEGVKDISKTSEINRVRIDSGKTRVKGRSGLNNRMVDVELCIVAKIERKHFENKEERCVSTVKEEWLRERRFDGRKGLTSMRLSRHKVRGSKRKWGEARRRKDRKEIRVEAYSRRNDRNIILLIIDCGRQRNVEERNGRDLKVRYVEKKKSKGKGFRDKERIWEVRKLSMNTKKVENDEIQTWCDKSSKISKCIKIRADTPEGKWLKENFESRRLKISLGLVFYKIKKMYRYSQHKFSIKIDKLSALEVRSLRRRCKETDVGSGQLEGRLIPTIGILEKAKIVIIQADKGANELNNVVVGLGKICVLRKLGSIASHGSRGLLWITLVGNKEIVVRGLHIRWGYALSLGKIL